MSLYVWNIGRQMLTRRSINAMMLVATRSWRSITSRIASMVWVYMLTSRATARTSSPAAAMPSATEYNAFATSIPREISPAIALGAASVSPRPDMKGGNASA